MTLEKAYGQKIKVYEGIIFRLKLNGKPLSIFMTHGHQGDLQSDGNWVSKWFVSNVWGLLQAYLRINPNTLAYNNQLKSIHNFMMYIWMAKQSNLELITGHTRQPVFNSLTHLERLYIKLEEARKDGDLAGVEKIEAEFIASKMSGKPSPRLEYSKNIYFNIGCCCFCNGDLTDIKLEGGRIRLIKWKMYNNVLERIILEEAKLESCWM